MLDFYRMGPGLSEMTVATSGPLGLAFIGPSGDAWHLVAAL